MNINKIKNREEFKIGEQVFEITIKEKDGEVIYQGESVGGIVTIVEKLFDIKNGEITGQQQLFGWGNIMLQWYGFDQLKQYFHKNAGKFVDEVIKIGALKGSPETIEELKRQMEGRTK